MKAKAKSLLDDVPVDDKAFPLNKSKLLESYPSLDIVGTCPKCGAPIYGMKRILSNVEDPSIKYTCECRVAQQKDLKDTMVTK